MTLEGGEAVVGMHCWEKNKEKEMKENGKMVGFIICDHNPYKEMVDQGHETLLTFEYWAVTEER